MVVAQRDGAKQISEGVGPAELPWRTREAAIRPRAESSSTLSDRRRLYGSGRGRRVQERRPNSVTPLDGAL